MSKKIDCIIVSGFLGSGKTTFVNQLLQQIDSQKKVALAINDFGKINLDQALVNISNERIISLKRGCMCCSLAAKFILDFDKLYEEQSDIDTFIIEASGITNLDSLIQIIESNHMKSKLNLTHVISTVDASNFIKLQTKLAIIKQQVLLADTIILNYRDTTSPELFEETKKVISQLNSRATVHETSFSKIPVNFLGQKNATLPIHQVISTFSNDKMFTGEIILTNLTNEKELVEILNSLPDYVFRAKGIIETSYGYRLIEKVGRQINVKPFNSNSKKFNYNIIVLIGWKSINTIVSKSITPLKNAKFESNVDSHLHSNVNKYC